MEAPVATSSQPQLTPTDAELVHAINGGDANAFEDLYRRYRDWVVGLAYRVTGDQDAALDVLQEVFLYVLKKFPGFRLTSQFKTFLYPVVKNLSIAARRKTSRFQGDSAAWAQAEATVPAPEAPVGSMGDLESVLAELPPEQREVLLLRFVEGFSLAEIAEALQIPVGTAKSRLHHGLKALRLNPRTKAHFESQ